MPVLPPIRSWALGLCLVFSPGAVSAADSGGAREWASADSSALPVTGKVDPRMAPFDTLLTSFVVEKKIPGASVAVSRHGRLVYARGFGYADVESKTAVEPDALFRIASISKPITAAAVQQLIEQGKLGLDERAFERFDGDPALRAHGTGDPRIAQVTVRQLLQHTGGWDRDASFDPMFRSIEIARELNVPPPAGPAQVIRYMRGKPVDFNPGERYAYSNFGYCVLGRLIEKASGQTYEDYVREQVLRPLGITRMRLGRTLLAGRAAGEVRYYESPQENEPAVVGPAIGQPVPSQYGAWCLEAMDSHGGWIASAIDLVRFASAFDDPERCPILKAKSLGETFARPQGQPGFDAEGKPKPFYYALGWLVRPEGHPAAPMYWHTGSLPGTSTILVRRSDGLAWAVLFNTRNGAPENAPARQIDPLMHKAADAVAEWPE